MSDIRDRKKIKMSKPAIEIQFKSGKSPVLIFFPGLGLTPGEFENSSPRGNASLGLVYSEYRDDSKNNISGLRKIAREIIYRVPDFCEDRPIIFLSHSMGSIVAGLCVKELKPRGWINFEGNLDSRDCFFSRRIIRQPLEEFVNGGYFQLFDLLEKSIAVNKNPSMRYYFQSLKQVNPSVLWQHALDTVELTDSGDALNCFLEFKEKKMYIVGSETKFTPTLAGLKKNGILQVEEVGNSGHFMLYDNPGGCRKWVEKFLL